MDRMGLEMKAVNRSKRILKKEAAEKASPSKKKVKKPDVKKNTEAARKSSKKLDKLLVKNSPSTLERMGRLLSGMKAEGFH